MALLAVVLLGLTAVALLVAVVAVVVAAFDCLDHYLDLLVK